MTSLSNELKRVIVRRLENAPAAEVLAIASSLCEPESLRFGSAAEASSSQPRFVKLDRDGDCDSSSPWFAVHDTTTDLIWSCNDIGTGRSNWADAKKAAESLKLCGFEDWRLPTIKELLTLVDYDRHDPAIDKAFFPSCKSDWYWTSTPLASSPGGCAWGVVFGGGGAGCDSQDDEGLVRAVRARQ